MQTQIREYRYEGQLVEFDLTRPEMMINATEMAKIFNAQVAVFIRNDSTQAFIEAALKSENSHFLGVKGRDDLYVSRQRSGTWMHRVLALKFAAWLDPNFELWVYMTIDQILFGKLKEQDRRTAEQAAKEVRRRELEAKFGAMDEFRELQSLRASNQHFFKENRRQADIQLEIFADRLSPRTDESDSTTPINSNDE